MQRDFKNAKSVTKYLEKRYGEIKGNTIGDDIQYIADIEKDHTRDELKMMSKRINAAIAFKKDTGYLDNHIFLFMGLLITVFSTMGVTIYNTASNLNLAYINNFLKMNEEEIKQANNLSEVFKSVNFSSLFDAWVQMVILILAVILVGIVVNIKIVKKPIDKLYYFSVLIEETLELKPKEDNKKDETPI